MPLGAFKQAIFGAAGSVGDVVLLATQTASSSASLAFTSSINSTYKQYIFSYSNMHPATDGAKFQCNFSTDGGSNYNINKTSTAFMARHREGGAVASLAFYATEALDNATGYQPLSVKGVLNDADAQCSGIITLYNPSSTTFVKQYISEAVAYQEDDEATNGFVAGYANTTSAINAVAFQFSSGNIDAGTIKMYGVK